MPTQPTNSAQNTGLIVIVVGIFMVIVAFLAVSYLTSDDIRTTQDKTSRKAADERSDLTQITCALWKSVGDPGSVEPEIAQKVQTICK